jgi:hypothetical protein
MPEQRADKNGKLVVRHVKANSESKLRFSSLPAPSLVSREESPDEIIKREFMACGSSEHEATDYVGFLQDRGETTKRVVADALMNRRDEVDFRAIKHVIAVSMDTGVMQLATSDVSLLCKVAECFPADGRMSPQRAAFNVIENTFRENFRLARFQDQVHDIDYLKHAVPFRAAVVAQILDVKDSVSSSFEARAQEEHIQENIGEFIENLPEYRKVSLEFDAWAIKVTSRDLLGLFTMVKECDSTVDAAIAAAVERKRYNEEEIRAILTTAPALSQGAI